MTTYHNRGDPVGRRHPINPHPAPVPQRGSGALPMALVFLAIFGAAYALFTFDVDPHGPDAMPTTSTQQ